VYREYLKQTIFWEWINIAFNILIDLPRFSGVEEDSKAIKNVHSKKQGKPYNNLGILV
jgi:hypothetical protein